MWLLNDGWYSKIESIKESKSHGTIFVGKHPNTVAFIDRSEIEDYFDDDFWAGYNLWQKWHMGFGLPLSKSWYEHPKNVIDVIEYFDVINRRIENSNK